MATANVFNRLTVPLGYDRDYTQQTAERIQRALTYSNGSGDANPRSTADRQNDWVSAYDFKNARVEGIQRAVDYALANGYRGVFLPDGYAGLYQPIASIEWPSDLDFWGASRTGCVIDAEFLPDGDFCFVNQDPAALQFSSMSNLTVENGAGMFQFNATEGVSFLTFQNVIYQGNNVGTWILGNQNLETSCFINCCVFGAMTGIKVVGGGNNNNTFINPQFGRIYGQALDWGRSQATIIIGGGVGGGGAVTDTVANPVLKLDNAAGFQWLNGYFEDCHQYLVVETNSNNGVRLEGRFTGAPDGVGGLLPFLYHSRRSDGSTGIITLPPNGAGLYEVPMAGPDKVFLSGGVPDPNFGDNNAVYTSLSKQSSAFTSARTVYPVSGAINLITLTRGGTSTTDADLHSMTMTLAVQFYGVDSGGTEVSYSREYRIFVRASGTNALTATLTHPGDIDTPDGSTFAVQLQAGATATAAVIEAVFTSMPTLDSSEMQWQVRVLSSSTAADSYIVADLP